MNTVYLTQAEPLLRGAHAATIKQDDRDALRLIHSAMLRFMRGYGIFYGEIPADKASKTRAPKTCGGDPIGSAIMDEDDAREKDMREKLFTLQSENDAWRADSQMLADICNLLTDAMPGFKGVPSTPEWTVAAVRELIQQRDSLIAALKDTLSPLQDAQNQLHHRAAAAAYINAREIIRHCEHQSAEQNILRGQS